MKLFILFGQRKQRYEGEYAPEALTVWDEYAVDENPGGFEEDIEATKKKHGGDKEFSSFKVIAVNVNGDKIAALLNDTPEVDATSVESA